jgi:hypothetical protein
MTIENIRIRISTGAYDAVINGKNYSGIHERHRLYQEVLDAINKGASVTEIEE